VHILPLYGVCARSLLQYMVSFTISRIYEYISEYGK
jgi:hypothetical protein